MPSRIEAAARRIDADAARAAAAAARRAAPKRTGRLAAGITASGNRVRSSAPYSKAVEARTGFYNRALRQARASASAKALREASAAVMHELEKAVGRWL